jgi:hypothetical protein
VSIYFHVTRNVSTTVTLTVPVGAGFIPAQFVLLPRVSEHKLAGEGVGPKYLAGKAVLNFFLPGSP